jgi:hypothetical protein
MATAGGTTWLGPKRRRASYLLGSTCDLEACLQQNYSVDDGCCGCPQTSLKLGYRENTMNFRHLAWYRQLLVVGTLLIEETQRYT